MASMLGLLVLLFPLLLLGFMLFMQRVEEPLNKVASERDIEHFLEDANRAELDSFVREGTDSALRRFRYRLRRLRLPSLRRRSNERASGQTAVPPEPTSGSADQRTSGQTAVPPEPTSGSADHRTSGQTAVPPQPTSH